MPLPTDGDAWSNADDSQTNRERLLDHIADDPGRAFNAYELADELLDRDWDGYFKKEEIIADVGEDEYWENKDQYDEEHDIDREVGDTIYDEMYRLYVVDQLNELVREGVVERRSVPVEDTEIPVSDWDTVTYYTYVGD